MGVIRSAALCGVAILALSACNKAANGNGAAQTAAAPAAPQLKPGLWETTTANERFQGQGGGFALRMCYDEATAKEANLMGRRRFGGGGGPGGEGGPECQQTLTRQADGSWKGNSVCEAPFGKMISEAIIRGDFNSAYTVEITARGEGENVPPFLAEGMKSTITAKRLGDCPAGYVGGDVEIDGQKVTAAEREARQAERRAQFGQGGPGGGFGGGPGGPRGPGGPDGGAAPEAK